MSAKSKTELLAVCAAEAKAFYQDENKQRAAA